METSHPKRKEVNKVHSRYLLTNPTTVNKSKKAQTLEASKKKRVCPCRCAKERRMETNKGRDCSTKSRKKVVMVKITVK